MKETLRKLSGTKQEGERDLSKWRLSKFVEICSEIVTSRNRNATNSSSVDQLFTSDKAWMVSNHIVKYDLNAEDETCIAHLIRMDVIITDSIDSLAHSTENTEQILKKKHSGCRS